LLNKDKFSKIILYITFFLVLFYPMKGLLSAFLSFILGADVSSVIVRFALLFTMFFIFLNLAVNNITLPTKIDKLLLYIGILGILIGIARQDTTLFYNTVLLFGLPVLFSQFRKISDALLFKVAFSFFAISTVYMFIENILIYPDLYGIKISPISTQQLEYFSNYLVGSKSPPLIIDDRKIGLFYRTGGYLANALAMPVILSMGSTFFYVLGREKPKLINYIFSIISVFLLLACLSTTAIIAFFLSVIIYEVFVRTTFSSLIILLLVVVGVYSYISFSNIGSYLFNRLIINLDTSNYYNTFFDFSALLQPINIIYFIVGKWNWATIPPGISSHVELILIPTIYGGIVTLFLYSRMLRPLFIIRKSNNILGKVFSLTVLTPFICLYHHSMTLNINVMLLMTLFIVKSGDISMRLRDKSKLYLSSLI